MWTGLPVDRPTWHRLIVLQPATAIAGGIAIDYFIILPGIWHPYAVAMAYHRSEVTYKDEGIRLLFTTSHEGHDAVVRIMDINPGETSRVSVQLTQSWFSLVEKIQVTHKIAQLGMMGIAWRFQQVPV